MLTPTYGFRLPVEFLMLIYLLFWYFIILVFHYHVTPPFKFHRLCSVPTWLSIKLQRIIVLVINEQTFAATPDQDEYQDQGFAVSHQVVYLCKWTKYLCKWVISIRQFVTRNMEIQTTIYMDLRLDLFSIKLQFIVSIKFADQLDGNTRFTLVIKLFIYRSVELEKCQNG